MTDRNQNGGLTLHGDDFAGRGGHHTARAMAIGGDRRGGPGDFISMLMQSLQNGPRRLGHPANPRGGSPFGSAGPSLADIFEDGELDGIFGKGEVTVMEIGPDGPHLIHRGEASMSDMMRLEAGEDVLGIGDMLKQHRDNPPSRNQRKLSLLSVLDRGMPLTLKLYSYAGHAGAEVARYLMDPDKNQDFAFVKHLAGVLAKAKDDDKEAFSNLSKRLKTYKIDLAGLIAAIDKFVAKPSESAARSVQMRLATAAPVALALLDDVSEDIKSTRESLIEKLRRTSKI